MLAFYSRCHPRWAAVASIKKGMDAKFDDEKSLVKQEDECIRTLFHLVPDIGILLIVRARRIDFYDEKPLPRLRVSIIFPPHSFLHPILRLFSR